MVASLDSNAHQFLMASPQWSPKCSPLDEPMSLSIADKAAHGLDFDQNSPSEHIQWELRMALERIHSSAGHVVPIGGNQPAENKPFDGMDAVSSAMLMELASSVMAPKQPQLLSSKKYDAAQRKAAIKRWMDKRSRRHLVSQTKYSKMKNVALSKNRSKGGKFIKKSERERLEREEAAAKAAVEQMAAEIRLETVKEQIVAPIMAAPVKDQWQPDLSEWEKQYAMLAQPEE